jgi:hypothetical protein
MIYRAPMQQSLDFAPTDERYSWEEGQSATGNPFWRLLDRGEETRWWVRHRLHCRDNKPYFIVTDFGAYALGTFACQNEAKAAALDLKTGRR